jgi:TPM domain/Protein kinase domain
VTGERTRRRTAVLRVAAVYRRVERGYRHRCPVVGVADSGRRRHRQPVFIGDEHAYRAALFDGVRILRHILGVPPHPVVERPVVVGELKLCDDSDNADRDVDTLPGQLGRHGVPLFGRVKPSNILLDDDDFAYLIDFGIARAADETRMTKSGNTIGTFAYIAPERLDPRVEEDARADIYSLACVLYEALTGEQPFTGTTTAHLIAAHLSTPPPRPSTTQPNVPPQVDEVIATGMAKDPDNRYATTVELADAARDAITDPLFRPTGHIAETVEASKPPAPFLIPDPRPPSAPPRGAIDDFPGDSPRAARATGADPSTQRFVGAKTGDVAKVTRRLTNPQQVIVALSIFGVAVLVMFGISRCTHSSSSTQSSSSQQVAAPPVGAQPTLQLADYVTDNAGVLTESGRAAVRSAIDKLYADRHIRLWVVYVDNFAGQSAVKWAQSTMRSSNFGDHDVLLAVSTGGRSYAFLVPSAVQGITESQVDNLRFNRIEPALRNSDWSDAAVAAADGLDSAAG